MEFGSSIDPNPLAGAETVSLDLHVWMHVITRFFADCVYVAMFHACHATAS